MQKVKKTKGFGWVYYCQEPNVPLDKEKCGKWMFFFSDIYYEVADMLVCDAVKQNIVSVAKHTDDWRVEATGEGVCCFYLNIDDIEGHKRVLSYFLDNGMIPITKSGKLTNISFKLDSQTNANEYKYNGNFKAKLRLSDFIDLSTGEWKDSVK